MLSILLFNACDDQSFDPVVKLNTPPSINTPSDGVEYILVESMAEESLTTFSWTAADFGFQAGVSYNLEFDVTGNNFAEANSLGVVNTLSFSDLSIGKFNNILLATGRPDGVFSDLEVRVCATINPDVEALCSNPLKVKVMPYGAEVEYPSLQVPGAYQDWMPESTETQIYSRLSDNTYEGYLYFGIDNSPYKYAQNFSWDTNWGDDEADGILNLGGFGNDILAEAAGMYKLNVNLTTLAHERLRTEWAIIGSSTNDLEIPLVWSEERQVLSAQAELKAGTFKFRANGSWDLNYGDNFGNGSLQQDGGDINILVDETYIIDLRLNNKDYGYTISIN